MFFFNFVAERGNRRSPRRGSKRLTRGSRRSRPPAGCRSGSRRTTSTIRRPTDVSTSPRASTGTFTTTATTSSTTATTWTKRIIWLKVPEFCQTITKGGESSCQLVRWSTYTIPFLSITIGMRMASVVVLVLERSLTSGLFKRK